LLDVLAAIEWDNLTDAQVVGSLKRVIYYLVKHVSGPRHCNPPPGGFIVSDARGGCDEVF
jgi:hypothetical protein